MARFNKKSVGTKTTNLAGGEAFKETPELELVSLLLTSFVNDKFYESADSQLNRLANLVASIKDKKFLGQAAIYARNEFGMRSITHALIGELVNEVKGKEWVKNAVEKTVRRPDDMTEMVSYFGNKYGKPFPNSLKKGLALAFNKFSAYQLAKYRGSNKDVKLVDVVNLVHPKSVEQNKEALKQLVNDELRSTETWESKLSESGKVEAETDEEKEALVAENKKEAWKDLLENNKLGYFALLRNIRNIQSQAPEYLDLALEKLTNQEAIKKSLVLPFRFMTAIATLQQDGPVDRKVLVALNKAMELSLSNTPEFDGKSLVVVDHSGSMESVGANKVSYKDIGNMFGAMLVKTNNADFMYFGSDSKYYTLNPADSLGTMLSVLKNINQGLTSVGHGTDFHSIFRNAKGKYDRIFIFSDMQGWIGYYSPAKEFSDYKKREGADPKIYSWDLAGYGTLQFPEKNVHALAGFSDKALDLLKLIDQDRNVLVNKIKEIEL